MGIGLQYGDDLFSIALGNRVNVLKRENEIKQKVVIRQWEEKPGIANESQPRIGRQSI